MRPLTRILPVLLVLAAMLAPASTAWAQTEPPMRQPENMQVRLMAGDKVLVSNGEIDAVIAYDRYVATRGTEHSGRLMINNQQIDARTCKCDFTLHYNQHAFVFHWLNLGDDQAMFVVDLPPAWVQITEQRGEPIQFKAGDMFTLTNGVDYVQFEGNYTGGQIGHSHVGMYYVTLSGPLATRPSRPGYEYDSCSDEHPGGCELRLQYQATTFDITFFRDYEAFVMTPPPGWTLMGNGSSTLTKN